MTAAPNNRVIGLELPSELGWEKVAMEAAASIARRMGFDADRVDDIVTAVSEAVCNAIEHGNRGEPSSNVGIVFAPEEDYLEITVRDQSEVALVRSGNGPPNIEERLSQRVLARGWGLFLIESLVDDLNITFSESGNAVCMVIRLKSPAGQERVTGGDDG